MDNLDLQIAIDGLAEQLLRAGKTADDIRELLEDEANRVADEIDAGEFDHVKPE